MAKRSFLTDLEVEQEIARLSATDAVKLARKEMRLKYKRRQFLYTLRQLEKRGKELAASGVTMENIDELIEAAEGECNE
jgi:hypothetical protein